MKPTEYTSWGAFKNKLHINNNSIFQWTNTKFKFHVFIGRYCKKETNTLQKYYVEYSKYYKYFAPVKYRNFLQNSTAY